MIGQCAADKRRMLITEVPTNATPIGSALFQVVPQNVIVLPVLFENQVKAVIELASIGAFTQMQITFLEQLTTSIGIVLNSIDATMQTEGLLKQSQQLAGELQAQQKELQQTNEQLEQKAQQLAERNVEVERKNQEIEQARRALEEKATELALTSKYKSEFLANMSHELRTPLNSILILGQQLTENPDGNLTPKQVEFARTIHGAGTDLLNLISDILDLSKIESGTVTVDAEEILFPDPAGHGGAHLPARGRNAKAFFRSADRSEHTAQHHHRPQAPAAGAQEPALQRLQIHRAGRRASCTVSGATSGWKPGPSGAHQAAQVIAFEVSDTGIGIPPEKQKIIFEAFQQADAGTSRKYGGTGLGLAISRELANLLGGEIQLAQRARARQHLHALPAADLCRLRAGQGTAAAGGGHGVVRRPAVRPQPKSSRSLTIGTTIAARRCHAADRRGRSALCPRAGRSGPRQGLQGAGGRARRRRLWNWRSNSSPPPSRWISSCPICWAGRCSAS